MKNIITIAGLGLLGYFVYDWWRKNQVQAYPYDLMPNLNVLEGGETVLPSPQFKPIQFGVNPWESNNTSAEQPLPYITPSERVTWEVKPVPPMMA